MNDSAHASLENRLRDHYRHLREQPPVTSDGDRPRAPRVLAIAACLALASAVGGTYLAIRDSGLGQPIQADLGAETGTSTSRAPIDPAAPTTLVRTSPSVPETVSQDPATSAAPSSAPDAVSGAVNVDGSPQAPKPGTVAPPADAELGAAFGIWEPGPHDTCSKATHDTYWVYGPDGKVYPTWHPPTDPATGCTFGHEHGRDPAGSDLADIPFPFGYVDEQGTATPRDHVGHKIEWYNDGGYYNNGNSDQNHDVICDVAYKVHTDTHSAAAFVDNAHEVFHYARCENGSELIYRALHPFGSRGEFNMHCDQQAGPTVTVAQPDGRRDGDAGSREVPASPCFEDQVLVPEGQRSDWFPFDERWTLYQTVDSDEFGRFFIQFQIFTDLPARYWNGERLAHTIDLCYVTGDRQVRDDDFCEPLRNADPGRRVAWDDPASPFNGADRQVFMADLRLDNDAQQNDWYTDIHGGIWSPQPFPGSIRQHVGDTPIDAAASYRPSPIRSIEVESGTGIHAPN